MTKPPVKDNTTFKEKLESTCNNCKPASIQVYLRNIKRLFALENEGSLPAKGTWLTKQSLFERYRKLPLSKRRHLSVAGVKASKAYKLNSDKWSIEMYKDSNKYDRSRGKRVKSSKEKALWPKKGLESIGYRIQEIK